METFSYRPVLITFFILISGATQKANAQLVDCLTSDKEALTDFKSGLKDPENYLLSWRGSNCCQWWGVGCDNETGAVIIVDLHNPDPWPQHEGLGGKIRHSLSKLKSLRYLDLSFNAFYDTTIPQFFGSFKQLQYLKLANAGFHGTIPSNLGNITTLRYLNISSDGNDIRVNNLDWLKGLTSLKYLSLNEINLSELGSYWVGPLTMLPQLTELHLSFCELQSFIPHSSFHNFSLLAVLDLSYNSLGSTFPNWLLNSSNLAFLDLTDNGLNGSLPLGFSELPNLEFLYLGSNPLKANFSELFKGSWGKLAALSFGGRNDVVGSLPWIIGNITSLTYLDLSGNLAQGNIPSSLSKLHNLRYLDLSSNQITGGLQHIFRETESCPSKSPFPNLQKLILSKNQLVGEVPKCLSQIQNLVELWLDSNLFNASIPASLGALKHLSTLKLDHNKLTGTIPDTLWELAELLVLDVSFNSLTGVISESHFLRLNNLTILGLSSNSFVLEVHPSWVPPFQVERLDMGSCHLGPSFPGWLKSQKNILHLDLSNASISDHIPNWFWNISGQLALLNFSFNNLSGQLPKQLNISVFSKLDLSFNHFEGTIPHLPLHLQELNLSNNNFSGPLPKNIGELIPNIFFLSLASNQFVGTIPASMGKMKRVFAMNLSNNTLSGRIPESIGNCSFLQVLDLQDNNLSGIIPYSLGYLEDLGSLHLRGNMFTGEIPSSFQHLLLLEILDLGRNRLAGNIPPWIGERLTGLRVLSLRSNEFSGELPTSISNLSSLQVLDLAENKLSGTIPASLANLEAMTEQKDLPNDFLYGREGIYYKESLVVNSKGTSLEFTKTLSLLTCIDLSGNHLDGELPEEIIKLAGLIVLNLSRNHLTGQISQGISGLHLLESLDLSSNMLSGSIPPSMASLTFLAYLNLSYNNLSGEIPSGGQMETFGPYCFAGNPGLCGPQLGVKCLADSPTEEGGNESVDNGKDSDMWFLLAVGLGFAAGLLVPFVILASRMSWSVVYFALVDKVADKLLYICYKVYRSLVDNF